MSSISIGYSYQQTVELGEDVYFTEWMDELQTYATYFTSIQWCLHSGYCTVFTYYNFSHLSNHCDKSFETTWSTKPWSMKYVAISKLQFTPAQIPQNSFFLPSLK